jgi:hypothetical protein
VAGYEQISSYVVAVLRGTRRLLLVTGLFRGPMLAWCFAYYAGSDEIGEAVH